MNTVLLNTRLSCGLLILILILSLPIVAVAQNISIHQYRHVAPEHVADFIERETTYWSEVAQKAINEDKLEMWALLQKVGTHDAQHAPNFLFVNTFKDIDAAGGIWDAAAVFPDVPMEKMETNSISTVTSMYYIRPDTFIAAAGVNPPEDYKYISIIHHSTSSPGALIDLENEHWAPFIKGAMDAKQTTQVGWGNATILTPTGEHVGGSTLSYDVFPNLKDALMPSWQGEVTFPDEGLEKIMALESDVRRADVYRMVKMVAAPPEQ